MDSGVSGGWGCTGLKSVSLPKFMSLLDSQNVTLSGHRATADVISRVKMRSH